MATSSESARFLRAPAAAQGTIWVKAGRVEEAVEVVVPA